MKKVDGFTDLVRRSLGKALAEADMSCGFERSRDARDFNVNPGGLVAGRGPEPFPGFDFMQEGMFGTVRAQGAAEAVQHKAVTLFGEWSEELQNI
jgi:hypothetical protein